MKTDLTKILSIGGQPGLYLYLAQSNGGVVVESLMDKQRKWTGPSARMTALSDISVYTQEEDELPLQDIFIRMKEHLKDAPAPDPRSKDTDMPGFFETVIPEYDRERFYASHMKKVLEWYNVLHQPMRLILRWRKKKQRKRKKNRQKRPQPGPQHLLPPDRSPQNRPA